MDKLISWKGDQRRKPLLLIGVRQVGKTYLLREFGQAQFGTYHYFNFEKEPQLASIFEPDLNPQRILNELSFHVGKPIDFTRDLILFDEIQACPNALTSLKYFQEDLPEVAICGAGSLLGVYLGPVSFPVGKVTLLHLRPMTFEEFLLACGEEKSIEALRAREIPEIVHRHLWNQLKHYFITGGMPEIVQTYCENRGQLFDAFSLVREKQEMLVAAYIADMAKHSGKVNAMHLGRLFHSVPTQLEKENTQGAARFKFKGVVPGVSHYQRLVGAIDWLISAGLVIKVSIVESATLPLRSHAKENRFKLLLFDVGILGSMSGLSPKAILDYDYGSYKGYFAENFVAEELLCATEQELFSWSKKSAEVEFLLSQNEGVVPLEVKAGSVTKSKSLQIFAEKYHPKRQIIVSGKPLNLKGEKSYYPLYMAGFLNTSML